MLCKNLGVANAVEQNTDVLSHERKAIVSVAIHLNMDVLTVVHTATHRRGDLSLSPMEHLRSVIMVD